MKIVVHTFACTGVNATTAAPGKLFAEAKRPVTLTASLRSWRKRNETPVTPSAIQLPTNAPPDEP